MRAAFAQFGDRQTKTVRVINRGRHQRVRLTDGVTKHDALVSGALLGGFLVLRGTRVHPLSDVLRLLAQGVDEEKRVGVEFAVVVGVADVFNRRFDHLVIIEHRIGGDLTAEHDEIVFDHRFAGNPAGRILAETRVQHTVADQVANFVGMSFGDRFR